MSEKPTPETCKHMTIRTWVIAGSDFEGAAGLWACADCGHKFVPISELMTVESQRDALADALRECREVLAMMTDPDRINKSSVKQAWSLAVAAEVKARSMLARIEGSK